MACQRQGCRCEEATVMKELQGYCSSWCANNPEANKPAVPCNCGHDHCVDLEDRDE